MFLKRVAIHGFKTFADPVTVDFHGGITCIVGPNGSGKSNVSDAIQWALGERSMKTLRSSKHTDVIFSGNSRRKGMQRAEVNLVFDNGNRALGIDFDEVTITRRIHADGESEYAINQTPCRLRDIHELFFDTGIGSNGYAFVNQGQIDAILSVRGEDRRQLFDEAAGIQKYRSKRHEARLKLDRTEANLTRVRDIIATLEEQLQHLEQQAEYAREYANYVRRMKELQLAILAKDYDSRLQKREQLQQQRHALQTEVDEATGAVARLEAEEQAHSQRLAQMEESITSIQVETTQVVTVTKATEGRIALAQERIKHLQETEQRLNEEIGSLRQRIEELQAAIAANERDARGLHAEADALAGDAREKEQRLSEVESTIATSASEVERCKQEYIELMRSAADKRNRVAAAQATINGLTTRVQILRGRCGKLQAELDEAAAGRQQAERALQDHQQQAEQAAAEAESIQHQRADEVRLVEELNQRAAELRDECASVRSRLATLREMESHFEGMYAGVRGVLAAAREGRLEGIVGAVAGLIQVPQELETAIEVGLGASLQDIVTENEDAAKQAIEFLHRERRGRATFLPLTLVRPRPADPAVERLAADPAVRGVARDLVTFDAAHRPVMEYLLNSLLVVEDMDAALRLARQHRPRCRLVTLRGELIVPGGAISGGSRAQKGGLLGRKREIGELTARLAELEPELESVQQDMEDGRQRLTSLDEHLAGKQSEHAALTAQVARDERQVQHVREEEGRLQMELQQAEVDCNELTAEIARSTSERESLTAELTSMDETTRQLERTIAQSQRELDERRAAREQSLRAAQQVRIRYAAVHERLVSMENACQSLRREQQECVEGVARKQEAIERGRNELQFLRRQIENEEGSLAELRAQQEDVRRKWERSQDERREIRIALNNLAQELHEKRELAENRGAEAHQLDLQLTQVVAEIEEMERRFREEFEITPAGALQQKDIVAHKSTAMREISELKQRIDSMGDVNMGAIAEFERQKERMDFLTSQRDDLETAKAKLEQIIAEIDASTKAQFMATFDAIAAEYDILFRRLFGGGATRLVLSDPDNILETGVEVRVQLPGKAEQDLQLLSGGERALTAIALLFAMIRVRPSPFCALDEVDAALDDSNVGKFADLLREFAQASQFIIATHNKSTMEAAETLYGVTMQENGVSKIVSVRLTEAADMAA